MNYAFDIRALAKSLQLKNIATGKVDLTVGNKSQLDFMYRMLYEEYSLRVKDRRKRLTAESRIPHNKKYDDVLSSPTVADQANFLFDFNFANENRNIVIYGNSCTGKTSLACEIGRSAINKDAKVIYTRFDEFINPEMYKTIASKDVIIIDDIFYITPSEEDMLSFYKLVRELEENSSLILVTNRSLYEWKESVPFDTHILKTLITRFNYSAQLIHMTLRTD